MSIKPLTKVCGLAVLVLLLAFLALGPGKWQPRTGLGWQIDQFAGYFAFTWMFCVFWTRPLVVGAALIAAAGALEALQALTPDRTADLVATLYSAGGVLAAALIADLFIRAHRRLSGQILLMPQRVGPALIRVMSEYRISGPNA